MGLGIFLSVLFASAAHAAWSPTSSLPEAYSGHALVSNGSFLYNVGGLGGLNGAGTADRVFVAPISGASVGSWRQVRPLPELVFFHAAVAAGDQLVVLGGYHANDLGLSVSDVVYVARILPDGELGEWRRGPTLPEPVFYPSAAAWNGHVYLTGGWNGQSLTNRVISSRVGADGELGAWESRVSLPEGVYTHAAVSNGTLYVLGGVVNGGTEVQSAVLKSAIAPDGSIGAWTATTALPQPLSNHGASIAAGRVLVSGGWTGSEPTDDVAAAPVEEAGALGAWAALDALPVPLYLHGQAASATHLFVSGGTDGNAPRAEVYSLPLPEPPAAPAPSDSLPPRTSLAVGEPRWTSGETTFVSPATPLELSAVDDAHAVGDGSGVGVDHTMAGLGDVLSRYAGPIRVANQGAHLLRWFSIDRAGRREQERSAALAVDAEAPVSAHSPARSLLSAADRVAIAAEDPVVAGAASGVAAVEVAVDGGAARAYEGPFGLTEGAHEIAYRGVDRLGNAEPWKTARFEVDLTAPETAWSLAGQALFGVDIVTPNTAITLTAADPGAAPSGVASTLVSIDGAAEAAYSGPFGLSAGAHEIRVRSLDRAGNAEDARVFRVAVSDFLSDAAAALESATLSGNASISGDLRAPSVAVHGSNAGVSGRTIREAPVAAFDLAAARAFAQAARDLGAIKLSGKQTLALEAGDYFASELALSGQSALSVSGRVNLFVGGPVSVSGGAALNAGGAADSLWLVSDGASVSVAGNSRSAFNLYAPNAAVSISGSGELAGRLLARTLALSGKGVVPARSSATVARAGKRKTSAPASTVAQPSTTEPVAPAAEKKAAPAPAVARKANVMPTLSLASKQGLSIVTDKGGRARGGERGAVTIPQGAAPSGLAVTVAAGKAPAPAEEKAAALQLAAAGSAVEFGPHGTRFDKPVTIELPFDEYREGLVAHYWNAARGEWEPLPSVVDRAAKVVRAETTHFSLYQVLAPAAAAVNVHTIADAYAFPNPARSGKTPTVRVEASGVDGCELKVFDVSGQLVHQAGVAGARSTYEFAVPGLGSGVYVWSIKAGSQTRRGRMAVIR